MSSSSSSLSTLQIRFRNTDGVIFKTFDEINNGIDSGEGSGGEYPLGHTVFLENRIIITDRMPKYEFTQLNVTHIIRIIKYALKYYKNIDKIEIYLPKLDPSMNKQAIYQYQFQNLLLYPEKEDDVDRRSRNVDDDDHYAKLITLIHV